VVSYVTEHQLYVSTQSFFMSTAFSMTTLYMTRYEQQSVGMTTWEQAWESPLVGDEFCFCEALLMLLADIFLYVAIGVALVYFRGDS